MDSRTLPARHGPGRDRHLTSTASGHGVPRHHLRLRGRDHRGRPPAAVTPPSPTDSGYSGWSWTIPSGCGTDAGSAAQSVTVARYRRSGPRQPLRRRSNEAMPRIEERLQPRRVACRRQHAERRARTTSLPPTSSAPNGMTGPQGRSERAVGARVASGITALIRGRGRRHCTAHYQRDVSGRHLDRTEATSTGAWRTQCGCR